MFWGFRENTGIANISISGVMLPEIVLAILTSLLSPPIIIPSTPVRIVASMIYIARIAIDEGLGVMRSIKPVRL